MTRKNPTRHKIEIKIGRKFSVALKPKESEKKASKEGKKPKYICDIFELLTSSERNPW